MNHHLLKIFLVLFAFSFLIRSSTGADNLYFPPKDGDWETQDPAEVGWDKEKIQAALDYAGENQSSGVVILHQGKILAEQHWKAQGFRLRNLGQTTQGHAIEDVASAQKSIASILVGIAQEKELLKLDDPVNKYLKSGWSQASSEQEGAITIRHLITMTSGLDAKGNFEAKPGKKWKYNTFAYAKTMDLVSAAAKMERDELTKLWLTEPLAMKDSKWVSRGFVGTKSGNGFGFATSARDLARFGLLILANGKWHNQTILSDKKYIKDSTSSSQKLLPYYGYLWWLNKNSFAPNLGPKLSNAPVDMFSASGALNRRCFVVPSLNLVVRNKFLIVIRDLRETTFAPVLFGLFDTFFAEGSEVPFHERCLLKRFTT